MIKKLILIVIMTVISFSVQADEKTYKMILKIINQPHGILLVTGPTGSGKTTTLYAALQELNNNELNISTVEDPVEYFIDGINQTQINNKVKMTLSKNIYKP